MKFRSCTLFAGTLKKLSTCGKENIDVRLDSVNHQLCFDRVQLLDEFFLEG
jgi:hypothetical protein